MKNLSLVFRSLALPVLLLTLNAAGAQEKQPLRYVDAATLTVIGKSMPTPKLFQRVDTARYELWQPVKNYSAFSTGLAVVFRTDSRTIRARWKTGGYGLGHNMTAIARKGLDLYIERDGQWVYAGFGLAQGRQPRQRAGRVYGRGRKDLSGLPAPVGRGAFAGTGHRRRQPHRGRSEPPSATGSWCSGRASPTALRPGVPA